MIGIRKEIVGYNYHFGLCLSFRDKSITFGLPFNESGGWSRWHINRTRNGTCVNIIPINPLPRWKHIVKLWLLKKTLKWFNGDHVRCHGCGEGIIAYSIKDPNHKETERGIKRWLVCEECVRFYDQHMSRRKIKLI